MRRTIVVSVPAPAIGARKLRPLTPPEPDFFHARSLDSCQYPAHVNGRKEGSKPPFSPHYSGVMPHKGWPGRNLRFFRHRIVPGMFTKAGGAIQEPNLDPPSDGRVRVTWIG